MKKYRVSLPPLDTLIFFEAAYRAGSFTNSAGELNVSQAAVSKRIRQLEDWMGECLFVRDGRRLLPTPLGDKLFQTTSMTLEFLQLGVGALREEAQRPLSIGANTAVGMFWLTPHLRDFGLSQHACPTRLITSDNPQDLFNDGNDLTVTYGDGVLPGRNPILLFDEELTPVAAPKVARQFGDDLRTIQDIPPSHRPKLLNCGRASPDWVDWRVWFQGLSFSGFEKWPVETLSTYSQTIGEAIKGKGIALGSVWLLRAELKAESLQRVGRDVLLSGRGYYVSHSDRSILPDGAKHLVDYLTAAAQLARNERNKITSDA
ncbi:MULTISPECIES: LysR family transcriptional regulator [unclassified Mesorhizobium]|uniref:LysR family transcriptional regulator n=1 Tax=unclassified Mesorhizobium TaxID=325217 RepID=UPI00067F362E|nr:MULTISPECIES: LysR family transcriptional regulator [unclassified Mesorhizobium]WJI67484.1 LysR family transcriptional regulator [Mesorhizobium sp. C399B]